MKAFLNRILEDSYNFNKLDTVLNLKLIDTKEKFENNEKLDNLVYNYKELTTVKDFLLSKDLCKIYKSCKILSFLLNYSSVTYNKDSKDTNKEFCDKEWDRYLEELTNTLLESINNNTQNNLINYHLFTLLHHLTLYLTNQLPELGLNNDLQFKVDKTKKPLINIIYNNIIKINDNKLDITTVSILKYYYKTNQLQLNSLDNDNPYLYQLNRLSTLSDDTDVLNVVYYLLYSINKNNLTNYFNNPSNSNLKFLSYILDQFILNKNVVENSEVNVYNLYELIIKLIKSNDFNNNNSYQNAVIIFELLVKLAKLLNSDLVLIHLHKLVQIVNLLFSYESLLLNYGDYLHNLLKLLSGYCHNFYSLINTNKLKSLINLDSFTSNLNLSLNNNTNNMDYKDNNNKDYKTDTLLKLYIYLTNNDDLELLISRLVDTNEVINTNLHLTLFNKYISNTLSSSYDQGLNYSLLVKMYNFIKFNANFNSPLLYQIQILLCDINLVNLVNK